MLRPALRTHRHALTRTLGPTHTRRAPRPPPLSPSAFGASDFISCFLDFNLPGQASPCPERASLSRLELSGVPCPQLGGVGSTGPALSSAQRVRGAAATTLPPLRAISRAEAIRGCPRELSPAPRAPPGSLGWASVAWASPPSPATIVKEVYFVRVAERRARGELAVPPPPQVSRSHLASGRNVVPLGFPSRENWGLGWRSDILGSRPSAADRSGDWLRDWEVSLGPASQVCPPVVSLHTCTRNPSKSGLDVCSPRLTESHPSGTVLERVVGHFLGSRVLARQTPGASRATKAGFGKDRMGQEKFVCGNCGLEWERPAQGTGTTEERPPSDPSLT